MAGSLAQRSVVGPRKPVAEPVGRLEIDFDRSAGLVLSCLKFAIAKHQAKGDYLAQLAEMTPPQLSKVVNASPEVNALHKVLDALPHDVFVTFMQALGRARGLRVYERDTAELSDDFFETLERLVNAARLLTIRRPTPAKALLPADPEE